MPIYEYSCDDCGTRFEKLVRRTQQETGGVACPSCGEAHLTPQYSTFAAHAGNGKAAAPQAGGACASMPSGGCCGGGMCGMNYN